MTVNIEASVGKAGRNQTADVIKIQRLLTDQGVQIGGIDGRCGPRTIEGITIFQSTFLDHPDGRIDPASVTLSRLNRPVVGKVATVRSLTSPVPRASLDPFNVGLEAVTNAYMTERLGKPRESFGSDCQPVTNAALKKMIQTESVGPFRATGLAHAIKSLRLVMADIEVEQPAVYKALGTAGMLCCRYVRGSTTAISNHSWGTAVDLTLNDILDRRGDGFVQYGLTLIAPIFNRHQWYWGAGFPTEDAMHFEVSRDLLDSFKLPKV